MRRPGQFRFFATTVLLAAVIPITNAQASGPKRLADEEMRGVYAAGMTDFLFDKKSFYYSDGTAVEIFGDSGRWLNPPTNLGPADLFTNLLIDLAGLAAFVDRNGDTYIRMSGYIDEVNYPEIHLNSGPSFGSITIRGIDLNGTTLRISRQGRSGQ